MQMQTRRAVGHFLIGLGAPISAACLYPFIPSRSGPGFAADMSRAGHVVLIVGGAIGLGMVGLGLLLLKVVRRNHPSDSVATVLTAEGPSHADGRSKGDNMSSRRSPDPELSVGQRWKGIFWAAVIGFLIVVLVYGHR